MADKTKKQSSFFSRESSEDWVFDFVVTFLVVLATLLILYPLYFVVIASFSNPNLVESGQVLLIPKEISFEGFRYILKDARIWTGYRNTIFYTVTGTLLALVVTVPAAYALSREDLLGSGLIMKLVVFTMYFSGGLIPTYLVVNSLNLVDTPWVLIILGCFSSYNLIVCRTFFKTTIPIELQEAASIDGCTIPRFFFSIVLPLSKSILAIMTLYYAVAFWNEFFNGLIYVNKASLQPLQLVLRDILIQGQSVQTGEVLDPEELRHMQHIARTIRYGVIIVSSLPVLIFYPFVQKHFVKGVMVGSVKG